MPRSFCTDATVLSIKPQGENNASVCFISRTEGILYATMYGGRKSRLKSLVSPWNTGSAYFSSDKANFIKITDFDVCHYHITFRENLLKNRIASLAAEVALKTKCAGSPEKCWALLNGFIDGLDLCETDEQCKAGLIRFLWRYLELLGIRPETACCAQCQEALTIGAYYTVTENEFRCPSCAMQNKAMFLHAPSLAYLAAVSTQSPAAARNAKLLPQSVPELLELLLFLIESACGSKLNTLKTDNLLFL